MPTAQQLTQILNAALQKLWCYERDLFTDETEEVRTIHERAIVAWLFHYLVCETRRRHFSVLTWDCEYNRQEGNNSKRNADGDRVTPDLILHRRNTDEYNTCIIEVKCHPMSSFGKDDVQKDFKSLIDILNLRHYKFAIELIISKNSANLIWLTKNNQISNITTTIKCCEPLDLITVESTQNISFESSYTYYVAPTLHKCVKDVLNELCRERKVHLMSISANRLV